MTGPEHYRKAEEMLGYAFQRERGSREEVSLFAEGLVHAVLALAAATAVLEEDIDGPDWKTVAGTHTEAVA